jgi:hypothetical protein
VGAEVSVEEAQTAAKLIALNLLSSLKGKCLSILYYIIYIERKRKREREREREQASEKGRKKERNKKGREEEREREREGA